MVPRLVVCRRRCRAQAGDDLLEATHTLAANAAAVVPLERLLHVGIDGSVERYFRDVLRDAGLAVDLVAPSEATLRPRDVGELLQAQLARCRCISGCERADPSADADTHAMPVTVAGLRVSKVPTAALDELATRTAQGAAIEVERPHGQWMTLECPAPRSAEHGTMLRLRE